MAVKAKTTVTLVRVNDGAAGKGIKSVTNYYLAISSGSGVTASTSGWTTAVQNISASNKYLWNYEKITYTDNSTSSTTPCIIGVYGDKGNTGETGATGNGISSIVEYYALSTSNSTAPTSWQTTVPTLTATNKYMWNYEKITYTNGTTNDTAKRVIGVYGDKGNTGETGSDGRGVKSTAVTYQAWSNGTSTPTGTWSTSVPTTTAAKPYLWTRTIITYTDNTTSTSYSVGSTLEGVKPLIDAAAQDASSAKAYTDAVASQYGYRYKTDITVNGERTDCYYPVYFAYGNQNVSREVLIARGYNEKAPDDWHTASHKGGLTFRVKANYGFWGGATYKVEILDFSEIYSTMVADVAVSKLYGYGMCVWLRGGGTTGALYHVYSDQPLTYSSDYSWHANVPIIAVNAGEQIGWNGGTEANPTYKWIADNALTTPNSARLVSLQAIELAKTLVKDVDVEYYLSTSSTSLSGGSWSTTAPAWVNGKYMWSRTKIVNGKNETSYFPSANGTCIAGATGATGAAGKGVKSIAEQYYQSTSATAQSGGSWSTTVPTWVDGKYIWTRSVITYTDNSTTTTTAVCVTGQKGATGATGKGVKSTVVTYQAGASGTSAPTGTWSSSVPKTSATDPYLWSRTIITYTDNTTSTTYSVGSTPEGIVVGGRNLLYDTKAMTVDTLSVGNNGGESRWYKTWRNETGTGGSLVQTTDGIKLTFGGSSNVSIQAPLANFGSVENNEVVTLSFEYRGNIDRFGAWYFLQQTGNNVQLTGFPSLNPDGTWHKYTHTFSSSQANVRTCVSVLMFYNLPSYDSTKWVEVKAGTLKLEIGNKATDWSPAPEDMATGEELDAAKDGLSESIGNLSDRVTNIDSSLHENIDNTNTALQLISSNETRIAELIQQSDSFEFNFNTITTTVSQLNDKLYTEMDERLKYIKFIDGEIWLGKTPEANEDDFKVVISNERVKFLQNGNEVAFLSNNKLYITDARVTNSLRIGNYLFSMRSNGNLGIVWNVDE